MTTRSRANLAYWIPTALVALLWSGGAVGTLMGSAASLEVFRALGYPPYFAKILACAQLLGVASVLLPVPRALREWAYAGLTFDVTCAILSIAATSGPPEHFVFPSIGLCVVLASYRGWRARPAAA